MSRLTYYLVAALVALLACSCEDSGCPCSINGSDPPIAELIVSWDTGTIGANLMPIVPPDPVVCQATLILENTNPQQSFSKITVPTADVILVRDDSTLGTIPLETDWDGRLAPGKADTILFFKSTGDEPIFDAPCGERVLLDFTIRNADGDTKVFRPDTLTFFCVF